MVSVRLRCGNFCTMPTRHHRTAHFLKAGIYSNLSTFSELESRITQLDTNLDRGDAFEVFAQAYLATQKTTQAKTVWPFGHLPTKFKQKVAIDTPRDMGVDGAFETVTGDQCAYQVKFRSGRSALPWKDISTFMGLTEQVDERVLFTNSDDIPELMNDRKNFYCIRGSDLDRLEIEDFVAIEAWLKGQEVTFKHKTARTHQAEAVKRIHESLQKQDRSTAVFACGTGKILICYEIIANRGRYLHSALTHHCRESSFYNQILAAVLVGHFSVQMVGQI